jgi:hypothetical protein
MVDDDCCDLVAVVVVVDVEDDRQKPWSRLVGARKESGTKAPPSID